MRVGTTDAAAAGVMEHPQYGHVQYRMAELPLDADGQVEQTVGLMRERVREAAGDRGFREWARGITGEGADLDKVGNAYGHVKGALRFQRDEATGASVAGVAGIDQEEVIEVIVPPKAMMAHVAAGRGVGDCDDYAMYLAAILEAMGIPCAFVTVAADGRAPEQYSHVYVAAYPDAGSGVRERVALDASHGRYPGWEVVEVGRKREWGCGAGSGLVEWIGKMAVGVAVGLGIWWGIRRSA